MESRNNLVICYSCNIVLEYADYISHCEICRYTLPNNYDNNNDNNDNNDNDDIVTHYGNENENENENNILNINNIEPTYYDYDTLYNPMINRNFYNENLFNTINNISNVNQIDDLGLGIENLSLYSTQIPITEDSYCVICMNTYEKGNSFYLMKCMHSFCDDCSKRWFDFKSVCPLCKTNMRHV